MRHLVVFIALVSIAPLGSLAAQRDTLGALEGTIHERSGYRSVLAAKVMVRRVEPDTTVSATAAPDANGRYRLDSIPAGRYRARVVSPALDSLLVPPPETDVRIAPGRVVLADFTLPAGTALRDTICRGSRLPERRAAVAGRAFDADADGRPLVGADLQAIWMEFPVDRLTHHSVPTRRVVVVRSGQRGEYRICGVPTETLFTLQLRNEGRASAVVRLIIADDEGAIARDLSLGARTAPTIAALDSAARVAERRRRDERGDELQMVGTSALAGVVRGLSGEPFAGAEVHVRHARSSTITDNAGRFALDDLPAGTQMLVVGHPGYSLAELPVELRPGKRVEQDVLLVRPLTLEDIQDTDLEAFDAVRRSNQYGQFLTREQIGRKKHAAETVDLFDDLLGFTTFGRGRSARVVSNIALANKRRCSEASVIVQGGQGRRINDVTPNQIAGIEAYADAAFVPARFAGQADCGVVVIWLQRPAAPTPRPAVGLKANGYP